MKSTFIPFIFLTLIFWTSCNQDDPAEPAGILQLQAVRIGTYTVNQQNEGNYPVDQPVLLEFTSPLNTGTIIDNIALQKDETTVSFQVNYLDNNRTLSLKPDQDLEYNSGYQLKIDDGLRGENGETFAGTTIDFTTRSPVISIESITLNDQNFAKTDALRNIENPVQIVVQFDHPINTANLDQNILLTRKGALIPLNHQLDDSGQELTISAFDPLEHISLYQFELSDEITKAENGVFAGFENEFYTAIDSTYKFPEITEDQLLTKVQEQTFRYFWDFAHPVSGLARERNTSGEIVTIGGSGFGIMAMLAAIERGFITRDEGLTRMETITSFLKEADRFHGVWPHWMNGSSGEVIPFSEKDNGGDLVETSFMIQGLLSFRAYLNPDVAREQALIDTITELWESVEWNWYTKGGENVLYWHWSPDFQWEMNLPIRGYNEALITYVLATSSPTFPIESEVYHQGWTNSDHFINGEEYYNLELPLGFPYGGPLFFTHYSFLGLNPNGLSDQYANYWTQNVNHTLINQAYCVDNPLNYIGYSEKIWGLTASDNHLGYSAHSPTNDLGVITPTAAISSLPYAPEASMETIRFFYYILGDKLWGQYGFYDAFNFSVDWVADSYLAIDQGPIIVMIENYRTGLLWNLFMSDPEVQKGLNRLGFSFNG